MKKITSKIKHLIKISNLSKNDYEEIFRRADILQKRDTTKLCNGKVLGVMFFQESTRTISILQSAIIKLGGGWIGITNQTGSYVDSKKEKIEDTIRAVANSADVMAIRHDSLGLSELANEFPIPLINGGIGTEEHALGALWWVYWIYTHFEHNLKNIRVGFYGMLESSRSCKSAINLLSLFGTRIYTDSIIEEFGVPQDIQNIVQKNGSRIIESKLKDFIKNVDFLIIAEGLAHPIENKSVKNFITKYNPVTQKDFSSMKNNAFALTVSPRKITHEMYTVETSAMNDKHVIDNQLLSDAVFVTMGLITLLLGIDV